VVAIELYNPKIVTLCILIGPFLKKVSVDITIFFVVYATSNGGLQRLQLLHFKLYISGGAS
jgi:hypothetical protein